MSNRTFIFNNDGRALVPVGGYQASRNCNKGLRALLQKNTDWLDQKLQQKEPFA